jgi:hypothetical protein
MNQYTHLAVGELEQAVRVEGIPRLDVVEAEYQPFLGCRVDNLLDVFIRPSDRLLVLACADVQMCVCAGLSLLLSVCVCVCVCVCV